MKVAIDSGPLSSGHAFRGIGVHTRRLLEEFKLLKDKNIRIDAFDFSSNKEKLVEGGYDIVHYTSFHPHISSIPLVKVGKKTVITIHDLIRLIYPDKYPAGIRGEIRFLLQKYLLRNVDAIITISETSKKDICRFIGVNPDRVHVVYLAPSKFSKNSVNLQGLTLLKKKYDLPKRFVLYIGDVNYNKNIPTLLKACKIAKLPLVICGKQAKELEDLLLDLKNLQGPQDWGRLILGKPHPELAHIYKLSEQIKNDKETIRLGYVSDEELDGIFNLASVYCQPSYYEGFGLSILEAMSRSCPVVATEIQAHVEIADKAALFVDPNNPKDMADKILRVVNDPSLRKFLINSGLSNLKRFSWEKAAKETLEVYKQSL